MPSPKTLTTFEERRTYAEALREVFAQQMRVLGEQLTAGEITLQEWQIEMRSELRRMNALMLITGAGGDKDNVDPNDWLRLGPELKKQYEFLENFAKDISSGKTVGYGIQDRAALYARSTYASFWREAVPVDLPAVPGDGSTQCLTNCLCQWQIEYEYTRTGRVKAVLATWKLDGGEHCKDCEKRAEDWNPLRIPVKRSFVADDLFKSVKRFIARLSGNSLQTLNTTF